MKNWNKIPYVFGNNNQHNSFNCCLKVHLALHDLRFESTAKSMELNQGSNY